MVKTDIKVVSTAFRVVSNLGYPQVRRHLGGISSDFNGFRRHLGGIDYEFVIPIMLTRTYVVENKYGEKKN